MAETSKICLNMIVKNEAKIILNTLKSLAPYIDYYIIFDTGSLDETPEIIRGFFEQEKIPGELHFIDFINFEQARNTALQAAQASKIEFDYIFLCDADLELQVNDPEFKTKLSEEAYSIRQYTVDTSFANIRLVQKNLAARYIGATHEFLSVPCFISTTDYIYMKDHATGVSRENKSIRDIRLLTKEFEKEPTNTRFCFYLAMSYADLRLYKEAIYYFNKRIELGGWEEEAFYSYLRIALCHKDMMSSEDIIIKAFQTAYDFRPSRAEPLYELMLLYKNKGDIDLAIHYGEKAAKIPYPKEDVVFVWKTIYDYEILELLAECYYLTENYQNSSKCYQQLIDKPTLLESDRERIQAKKISLATKIKVTQEA